MAKCEVCEKTQISARRYSFRGSQVTKKFLRKQKPNIKKVKVDEDGTIKKTFVCTRCIRANKIKRVV